MNFRQFFETILNPEVIDFANRHRIQITPDNKFILYHGTRNPTAKLIRTEGFFRKGTFFTEDYNYALTAQDGPMGTQSSRKGKMVVMKVKVDPALLWLGVRIEAKTEIPVEEID